MGLADVLIARIDKLIRDRLDAAISSRADKTDYTAARAARLDNLDAVITSRATDAGVWSAESRTLTSAPSVIRSMQHGTVFLAVNAVEANTVIAGVALAKAMLLNLGDDSYADTAEGWARAGINVRLTLNSTNVVASRAQPIGYSVTVGFCVVEFF